MAFLINACPKCEASLLEDAAVCHACGHTLDPDRARRHQQVLTAQPIRSEERSTKCQQCGEDCREGLVRCWKCGAFTRPEMEAAYRKLRESHPPVMNRSIDLPEIDPEVARRMMIDDAESNRQNFNASEDLEIEYDADFITIQDGDSSDDGGGDFEINSPFGVEDEGSGYSLSQSVPVMDTNSLISTVSDEETAEGVEEAQKFNETATEDSDSEDETAPESPKKKKAAPEEDPLLSIAIQDQKERKEARRSAGGTVVVFCPQGCKIRVSERHRGKVGKCPKCKATFIVPAAPPPAAAEAGDGATENSVVSTGYGKYSHWLMGLHWHELQPAKLKLKAGSAVADQQDVELAVGAEGLLALRIPSGGMFGGEKKKAANREAVQEHLRKGGGTEKLPGGAKATVIPVDKWQGLTFVQPIPPETESMFAGVPVFGEGRIALKVPKIGEESHLTFLSFSISEFRQFASQMHEIFGWNDFGASLGIPLSDQFAAHKCHYTKAEVPELKNLEYYKADKSLKLVAAGFRCAKCGIVVSEEGRKKEKLGGANGKGIAKAKCPKCSDKFGDNPLYGPPVSAAKTVAGKREAESKNAADEA